MSLNGGFSYRDVVPANAGGRTVLTYLSASYPHSDPPAWLERIATGEVLLDGRAVSPDEILRPGQMLVWNRAPWIEPDVPLEFDLLHEDDHLIAVSKPSGLPTMPAGGFLQHTLLFQVRKTWPSASPIHRLGRGTSGAVVFALTQEAAAVLSKDLRERRVRKTYLALAAGDPAWDRKTIEVPIGPVAHPRLGSIHAASPTGKAATSHARVLVRRGDSCVLEVEIETGRPHQIRIHLAAIGHPLVGDPLYEAGGVPRADALPGDLGYLLHAWRVECAPPGIGRLVVVAPPPPELQTEAPIEQVVGAQRALS